MSIEVVCVLSPTFIVHSFLKSGARISSETSSAAVRAG